jgi:hypothetical protein
LRFLWNAIGHGDFGYSVSFNVNTIYALPFQLSVPLTVDRLGMMWMAGVGGNNVRVAFYRDNGDTPDGGALIVQSGVLPVPVGAQERKEFALADTLLASGLYWAAVLFDADQADMCSLLHAWYGSGGGAEATLSSHSAAFAFGAFPNPFPVSAWDVTVPMMYLRIKSIP